ncbi:MAG: hypothetical protein A2W05_08775 [Candidatus Schekmanbacteria bacterium RBG_16_38_10]|uniref:Uncharacterized protein n=1 Tax=Candidatus Schekmanbacteria bacterium RBG_16_38_10 TaxID=1817879 RepID=A0A1F7RRD4_9BACT|nr:MAG: hypothetical protein A2W05_08775 [Candidatus Schekmanbacteria bacterium RBG_16_38_10]
MRALILKTSSYLLLYCLKASAAVVAPALVILRLVEMLLGRASKPHQVAVTDKILSIHGLDENQDELILLSPMKVILALWWVHRMNGNMVLNFDKENYNALSMV